MALVLFGDEHYTQFGCVIISISTYIYIYIYFD